MEAELAGALDDLILGRGVARGRHSLIHRGRSVRAQFEERLLASGFIPMTVREAPIEAGERLPAFHLQGDDAEIFTPTSRRKLFASERRRPDNDEWAVQLNLSSPVKVWACPALKEPHDVETVVAVNP
jgi:hypothetical protein